MAKHRIPKFTLEQRTEVVAQMLVSLPSCRWGPVSKLAREHGVSRTLLYEIRARVWEAIVNALQPREAGRPAKTATLTVDKSFIARAITILPMLKGSVRAAGPASALGC